jgi:hypothetical protein
MMPDQAGVAGDLEPTAAAPPEPPTPAPRRRRRGPQPPPVAWGAWGRLRFALQGTPTHLMELFQGLVTLFWGLWLLLPLQVFRSEPLLYHELARLAPEWIWGLAATLLALVGLSTLLGDGRENRARIAMAQTFGWLFVCWLFGLGTGWRTTAVPVYGMLALGSAWIYIRLERDRRRPG